MNKKYKYGILSVSAVVGVVAIAIRKRGFQRDNEKDLNNNKRVLLLASVASMIDLFNADNINILEELGYKVDVAANFDFGSITSQERVNEYKHELTNRGIGVYNIPIPRSPLMVKEMIVSYRMIREIVNQNYYDIIHCHSPIGGVLCRLACRNSRKVGTRVIYTAHGFHFYKGACLKSWIVFFPVEWICSCFTDLIITINQEDYCRASKFHTSKVVYVPGIGIHVDDIKNAGDVLDREAKRSEFGYKNTDFVFMSTGQVSARKNHEVVIRALGILKKQEKLGNIKYLIIGFGEAEDRLRKVVEKLGMTDIVHFAGYRGDAKELLHIVDAFVFPSIQEGLPVALMEAMAAGLPIVCSRIRGNTDLITDLENGYLVDCHSPEEFAKAMQKIVVEKDKSKSIAKSSQIRIQQFDTDRVNKKMRHIYTSIGNGSY